ncbi:MAG: hypothetical protein BJ554DRAFT_7098 [Olpidium bornovanus]|uniref:Uncharacterized protein n=1 Tax=Olpidium bornovanus TaxID=278681 RepID=A0A8H7ZWS4_9FUNG|nr:MAG: hypothetical protein BJ554DRAFT_7098 [Olpidium bornovanus]
MSNGCCAGRAGDNRDARQSGEQRGGAGGITEGPRNGGGGGGGGGGGSAAQAPATVRLVDVVRELAVLRGSIRDGEKGGEKDEGGRAPAVLFKARAAMRPRTSAGGFGAEWRRERGGGGASAKHPTLVYRWKPVGSAVKVKICLAARVKEFGVYPSFTRAVHRGTNAGFYSKNSAVQIKSR